MILAGDIGGTHTRLGLFGKAGDWEPIAEKKTLNQDASSLKEVISEFIEVQKVDRKKILAACLAVAGTVDNGHCHMTNLDWEIDAKQLGINFAIPDFSLINDLEAHAHGLGLVHPKDLCVLQAGIKKEGNQALVFSGTGLGEAGVYWNGKQFFPLAGEGGHVDFAPRDDLEIELFLYLREKYGHVSYERILSGQGIYEIYRFLIDYKKELSSQVIDQSMKKKNPSFVIIEHGRSYADCVCGKALDLFLSIYGAEAGNIALKFLCFGGLYIGGGMVAKLAVELAKSSFLASFCEKGRFKPLLQSIPVTLVMAENTALLGAAKVARSLL